MNSTVISLPNRRTTHARTGAATGVRAAVVALDDFRSNLKVRRTANGVFFMKRTQAPTILSFA